MLSVLKREMRQYFHTPIGYVFVTIFWLLGAVFFFLYNILSGTSDLGEMFGNLSYLFMLIVPLLTMRLLSAERRQKTDQLMYCTPTPLAAVVLGKFCAALCVVLVALAGTGIYLAVLARYATLQPGMITAYYVGFFLLCASYISIGVLMSALTESQITAAVLTFAANMLLQLVEMAAPTLHVPYMPFLPALLGALTLNTHYSQIASGVIRPVDVGYFLLFITVALSLTVYCLRRRQLSGR